MASSSPETTVDEQAVEDFAGRLFELFTGGALTYLIDIGHRTALFGAAASSGPVASTELAARAGLEPRVREALAMGACPLIST